MSQEEKTRLKISKEKGTKNWFNIKRKRKKINNFISLHSIKHN